ncbi:MAG: flagellar export protein FliJ [Kiloniellaceae bacterium]
MTALDSLVRVHRWILDEKRRKLGELQELAGKLKDDLRRLQEDLANEQEVASRSIEGTVAFPAFIAAARERGQRLRDSIARMERAIETTRDEVQAAFQEAETYKLASDNHARRERDRLSRREQVDLDELAASRYRRRTRGRD